MPNYRKMYGIMARASEKAIRILIEAQQQCEELAMEEESVIPIELKVCAQQELNEEQPGLFP